MPNLIQKHLYIGGMTCVNCQNKIEKKLSATAGIEKVKVSYSKGTADITYDPDLISWKDIETLIEKLDYQVLHKNEKSGADLGTMICTLVIILSLYVLLEQFGILNLLAPAQLADTGMGYGMLFVIGLITSVHCIAMCGGINLSQCIPKGNDGEGNEKFAVFRPAFLYNAGRVVSYTVTGFFLGGVGMLLGGGNGAGFSSMLQGVLKLIAGTFMVIMGINMLGLFPWLRRLQPRMPKFFAKKIGKEKARQSGPFIVGLLNGLMPCGPLQSMQIVALASGNPFAGAASMFLFSLGTVPLMLGLGSMVSALGKKFMDSVMKVGAVLVVVLGLSMLSQGGSLSGLLSPNRLLLLVIGAGILGIVASIPFSKKTLRYVSVAAAGALAAGTFFYLPSLEGRASEPAAEEGEIVDGVQVINSTLAPGRYPNITVQAGVPVKWVVDAPQGSINGCNYKIMIRDYGIEYSFQPGENIIEFTPTKAGTVQYSCWMGMIRGNIFVVDDSGENPVPAETVPVPAGYQIPTDALAIAEAGADERGYPTQTVSVKLTDEGFSPAVIVVEAGTNVLWNVENKRSDAENGTDFLIPVYSTKLSLVSGANQLYFGAAESFEVSTGDSRAYAYVKVVDDIDQIDEAAIKEEVQSFETIIYPDAIFSGFGGAGGSCCSGGAGGAGSAGGGSCCSGGY